MFHLGSKVVTPLHCSGEVFWHLNFETVLVAKLNFSFCRGSLLTLKVITLTYYLQKWFFRKLLTRLRGGSTIVLLQELYFKTEFLNL